MEYFSYDCPHCRVKRSGFKVLFNMYDGPSFDKDLEPIVTIITAACQLCGMPIVMRCKMNRSYTKYKSHSIFAVWKYKNPEAVIVNIWPEPISPNCPAHCPDDVEEFFLEGVATVDTSKTGAVMLLRRCLESALSNIDPNGPDKLVQKINAAAGKGLITESLKDWAHHIRLIGNDGAHGKIDPAEVESLVEFTRLVLTYLFTLPGDVAAAKAKKAAAPQAAVSKP